MENMPGGHDLMHSRAFTALAQPVVKKPVGNAE
jgi:hypothetical protein